MKALNLFLRAIIIPFFSPLLTCLSRPNTFETENMRNCFADYFCTLRSCSVFEKFYELLVIKSHHYLLKVSLNTVFTFVHKSYWYLIFFNGLTLGNHLSETSAYGMFDFLTKLVTVKYKTFRFIKLVPKPKNVLSRVIFK